MDTTMTDQEDKKILSATEILFPGKSIIKEIKDHKLEIKIYPLGIVQFKKFSTSLISAATSIAEKVPYKTSKESDQEFKVRVAKSLVMFAGPVIATDLVETVSDCCKVYLDGKQLEQSLYELNIPSDIFAEVCDVWVTESFSDVKKVERWIDLFKNIKNMIDRFTKKKS